MSGHTQPSEGNQLRRMKRAARAVLVAFKDEDRPLHPDTEELLIRCQKLIELADSIGKESGDEAV